MPEVGLEVNVVADTYTIRCCAPVKAFWSLSVLVQYLLKIILYHLYGWQSMPMYNIRPCTRGLRKKHISASS